jgi:hypothetical protein
MGSAISLRSDFDGYGVRHLARKTKEACEAQRLLALATIYDGGSRINAAQLGSVTVQIVRDWVMRFSVRVLICTENGMRIKTWTGFMALDRGFVDIRVGSESQRIS